jgi:hypothetical protein
VKRKGKTLIEDFSELDILPPKYHENGYRVIKKVNNPPASWGAS